jgi:hypothetical protein
VFALLQGWLLLLECYSRLMYRPSTDFEGAMERYCLGVLPGMGPEALASLVGSAARLQLPLSPQLEDGIITRLEQVRCICVWGCCKSVNVCICCRSLHVCGCDGGSGHVYTSARCLACGCRPCAHI